MATRSSLTGSTSTDALVPHATALISAVHDQDPAEVAAILRDAALVAGTQDAALTGLVIVLAAMALDDVPVADTLAWCANPAEYQRLRAEGVNSLTAGALAAARPAQGGVAA